LAARADIIDELSRRMTLLEGQSQELEKGLNTPQNIAPTEDPAERKLVEAQVAYGTGNYADATILLYDIVEKYKSSSSYKEAVFFLADSLYHKGDNLTARDYFHQIIDEFGENAPHYQEALERLVELSIALQDSSRVADYLARLDKIATADRLESVPYVRGKYLFFAKRYDEAQAVFASIDKASKYYFEAQYFIGATDLAKNDLANAAKVLHDLTKEQAKDDAGKQILELTHMALGRIHYERDQPSEAIDHYLMISRRSQYFDEALYEVAWVYVKAKQFDKALRALELLSLANPKSAMLPDVRILEGNLRIRKAQALATSGEGNSTEEYARASQVFEETRTTYDKPKTDLDKLMAGHADPKAFFDQLTGQANMIIAEDAQVPEVALEWIKQEPEVGRVIAVTKSLDEIRSDLDDTQGMIDRIEHAVDSPSRVAIFPELAGRKASVEEFTEENFALRQQLATHERAIVYRYINDQEKAELDAIQEKRKALQAKLAALPNSEDSYEDRIKKAKAEYQDLDKEASEVETIINQNDAEIVALDKYYQDSADPKNKMAPDLFGQQMTELKQLQTDLHKQLDTIRQEEQADADEAGIGDEIAQQEMQTRKELADAVMEEHAWMARVVPRITGDDAGREKTITALLTKADGIDSTLSSASKKIDALVDAQLVEVKASLAEEKGHVAEYRQILASYETEDASVGGDIVKGSFDSVSKKFYEIAVRADVGLLDVSWAQKEESQQNLDRLRLDFNHEKNTLDGEFRDVRGDDDQSSSDQEQK
jgi:hypothetical protein